MLHSFATTPTNNSLQNKKSVYKRRWYGDFLFLGINYRIVYNEAFVR